MHLLYNIYNEIRCENLIEFYNNTILEKILTTLW